MEFELYKYFDEYNKRSVDGWPVGALCDHVQAIQQRGHMQDVSGHRLAKNDPSWIHLCLPMEFEKE